MATKNTQEELKRQAITNLAASRGEIVAGIHQLRSDLSPKVLLHRLVDRHKGAVVGVTTAAGAALSLLVYRRMRASRLNRHSKPEIADQSVNHPTIGARILRMAGSLVPTLIKSGVRSVLRSP